MRFIPFPASSILSTKNAHKFCTFLLFSHTCLLMFFSCFFHGSDVLQPMLVSYMTSFLHSPLCAIEECILETFSSFSTFWMQAGSVRLARSRGWLFFYFVLFILICARLSISYNLSACSAWLCLFVLLRFHQFREMLCDFKS